MAKNGDYIPKYDLERGLLGFEGRHSRHDLLFPLSCRARPRTAFPGLAPPRTANPRRAVSVCFSVLDS